MDSLANSGSFPQLRRPFLWHRSRLQVSEGDLCRMALSPDNNGYWWLSYLLLS